MRRRRPAPGCVPTGPADSFLPGQRPGQWLSPTGRLPSPTSGPRPDRHAPVPSRPWPTGHESATSGGWLASTLRRCRPGNRPPVERRRQLAPLVPPLEAKAQHRRRSLAGPPVRSLVERPLSGPRGCEARRWAGKAIAQGPRSPYTQTVREPFAPGVPPRDLPRRSTLPPIPGPSGIRHGPALFRKQDGPKIVPDCSRSITWTTAHDESDQIQLLV